jgi:alanine-glyoxylate transaminase/serine-glyoxylate transaminase/serine-pyruvate transaminase
MNFALREGLALLVEEGLEARHARHALNAQALRAGLAAMGVGVITARGHELPQLTCARVPDGIDDLAVRKRLHSDWGIEVGGGLGSLKGKAWRIGLMGYGSRASNVMLVLAALETCLRDLGQPVQPGAGLAAASDAYAAARRSS